MSVLDILYTILIGPLQLVFEVIFSIANRLTGHPGSAIIALSLIMNFLVLPLYRRADIMQEEARDMDLKLQKGVAHIKKSFSGDERMMILQTYYRQNNYKPTDTLNGSVSLLLEVPFFIAAYQFLSHLQTLQGVSLGPITDLGTPDGLLVLGGITINLLPFVMTTVNILSSALYLKGFPLKTKIQLYAMALLFLVFLYTSPSGLVFYWTLNNLFSLVKNIFYKLKEPAKVLNVIFSIAGVFVVIYSLSGADGFTMKTKVVFVFAGLCLQLPLLLSIKKVKMLLEKTKVTGQHDKKMFVCGSLFLTVFVGALIPSAVIGASPMEFMDVNYNPLWYLVSSGGLAAGFFLVWLRVFYWLASDSGKVIFDKIVWIMSGIVIVNYMFFGTKMGTIFANLQYEYEMDWGFVDEISNFFVLVLVAVILYIFYKKVPKAASTVLLTVMLAVTLMTGSNVVNINRAISEYEELAKNETSGQPHFKLSKTGKNVIVLMLDRAMNQYVPYMFNEKSELQEQFAGFTYYPNTISHGGFTNFTTPALFGGYEYTPVENNKRNMESLEEKQNEALKVMPAIFSENDFEVTVCDPPYAGYTWIPDLSIYNELPEINTFITQGKFNDPENEKVIIENRTRNFFCFALMKSMPIVLQEVIYDEGKYNQAERKAEEFYAGQEIIDNYVSSGISPAFMQQYNVLLNLSEITEIVEEDNNTFLMMSNCITHEPMMLQEPEYEPALYVDNVEYSSINVERYTVDGKEMKMENSTQIIHYQTNMATFIQLGKWFDYMRENGVYDNTRIILVADHGRALGQFEGLILDNGNDYLLDAEFYYPLLMMKDFGCKEYRESDEFMTNADVPTMAMKEIIENPVNPYTGKRIENSSKFSSTQFILVSEQYDVLINNGNTFMPSRWLEFDGDDVWDKDSWKILKGTTVLPGKEN